MSITAPQSIVAAGRPANPSAETVKATHSSRFEFIDGLRGIAALAVVLFHCYRGSDLHAVLAATTPGFLLLLLDHGYLGVEIFFVISGFVISYSVLQTPVTKRFIASFVIRRSF